MSRRLSWTQHNIDKLEKVKKIIKDLDKYRPLTLRQIYYQLVGAGDIENKDTQYTMLSTLISQARVDGLIAWDDLEDRARRFYDLTGFVDKKIYFKKEIDEFLSGYRRNLMQSQDVYIEYWIEKDALSSIFTRVCSIYTIPVIVCRGFTSVSFLKNYINRINEHPGKRPIMLYAGDFDPSGNEMLSSMQNTLTNDLHMENIEFRRTALLKEDIFKYNLPHNYKAIKDKDSRTKKHVEEFGRLAVELDAMRPDILEKRINESIQEVINFDLAIAEEQTGLAEENELDQIKSMISSYIDELGSHYGIFN